ncbi:glycosyl transferase family group 2-domain-containing protein [Mycena floridula]|nr:glycosyl transferase family group 2-domain-containing protein [Mycena floridula]
MQPPNSLTVLNSDYDAFDALLHNIYEKTQSDAWFKPTEDALPTGVCIRVAPGFFRVFPYETPALIPFEQNVRKLNPTIAVKLRSASIFAALRSTPPTARSILIDGDTRIQILESIDELPQAEKDQCGAFIRSDTSLLLWSFHSPDTIIATTHEFEEKLIKYIWRTRGTPNRDEAIGTPSLWDGGFSHSPSSSLSNVGSIGVIPTSSTTSILVKETLSEKPSTAVQPPKRKWWSWKLDKPVLPAKQEEKELSEKESQVTEPERKLVLLGPFYAGCGAGLAGYFMLSGLSNLLPEYVLDGDITRFALCVVLPVIFCVSIFFALQLVGNLSLIVGPVAQYHENSAYYSAIKPAPNPAVDQNLPHITIQLPVYKESLSLTIAPSIYSIKTAMKTYARQGGTSAIFICEDGLQAISEEEQKERIEFYANHNIGWVARPKHDSKEGGFKRAGKFKKASNMNYGLALSVKLEKFLAQLIADGKDDDPTTGESLEDQAMNLAAAEMFEESGGKWKPRCANGKSLRMGEIILIIDADTIVPEDCFRDAAREMYLSPELAIIQHESDVMQVAHHYFENGITHFTRRINKCISYGCANGEVAPFVGHNAFLRWSAVQDASFIDGGLDDDGPGDGKRKIWSENNVSEDFDMALRLLLRGYTLRWATYSQGGFKEGVSLTVVDELARWQKYAYGCDEIIFNPLIRWWRKGPISDQLKGFVWSDAPLHYKVGMMSYMFSYYGIAAATMGSILNYLLLGLAPQIDRFYLKSFEIFLACTVVFPGLGNVGFTLLEYRIGHRTLLSALMENLRWVPFFTFFFGGLSIHLSTAILAHLFSYDMTWGSTGKEVEKSTFWIEVPRILKNFWLSFVICCTLIFMIVLFNSELLPFAYRIGGWSYAIVVPLGMIIGCHLLLPIILNPWLMKFSF